MGTDEKGERTWERLPRAIKIVVYETLREASARYAKDAAQGAVLQSLGGTTLLEDTNRLIAEGFTIATVELELGDPDLCPDCGEYHDPQEPTVHKKDLS